MLNQFSRTELLYGRQVMEHLARCRVAVFGIGGVGGFVAEALARSGIGALDLIDSDTVSLTNLNRQIIATHSSLGRLKTDVAKERIADINPDCKVLTHNMFFLPATQNEIDFGRYDYVADAVDTVAGKLAIIECAKLAKAPVISAMGAGNKLRADAFEVADIYQTSVCPLARIMRRECRKRNIESLKVVYSKEEPAIPAQTALNEIPEGSSRRSIPGSVAFVPSVAGLIMAGEIINDLAASFAKAAPPADKQNHT